MSVILSNTARLDLLEISRWIARDDPGRARSFVNELRSRIDALDGWPERFPPLDAEAAPGVRRMNHRGYRILYEIAGDTVTILHVHHGARDRTLS